MLVTYVTLGAWSRGLELLFKNKMNSLRDTHVLEPNSLQQVEIDRKIYQVAGLKQTSKGVIVDANCTK